MAGDSGEVGGRLRAERKARYLTVEALAEAFREVAGARDRQRLPKLRDLCRMIRGYEAGEHVPGPRYRMLYAASFGLDEDELFGLGRAASRGRRAAAATGFAELAELRSANGEPADAGYVETIRETSQTLVRLDTLHGGDDVFPLALRVFRTAHHKLGTGCYLPKVERDLIAATGEAGEVAAWLAYDADRQDASRRIILEALSLSRQAGDRDMELMELGHLAMQAVHLHRPADSLRIAREVLDGGNLPARVMALFEIRKGRALAQLGDRPGAFGSLDKARSVLADGIGTRDPYWTWWLNDGEVTSHRGMTQADMGDWKASVESFQDSADRRAGYRRARYNDLAHLLNALVQVRDWRAAEPVLAEVAGMVGEVGSGRTTHLLGRVADRVARSGAPSTITDAADGLRHFLEDLHRVEERTC